VLRANAKFHNGDPVTAEDVKFTFERYRGNARPLLREKVAEVLALDARRVRFRLHAPWPDFLTYYASVTGAAWVVPKAYLERVGEEAYRKVPIGAGPYRFVSFTPGVELVMEAFDDYWRRQPTVKKFVFKVIPDETTRLAALRRGEIDFAYSVRGELAEEIQRTPNLTLRPVVISSPFWLAFPDQWDPKSPWHDQRVRQAANLALDRVGISQALTLGHSPITNSIIPSNFDFFWQPPRAEYDPRRAKALLAEAGFRSGFDAGEYFCDSSYANLGEAILNNLTEVGIRARMRPIERAAFLTGYADKKYRNIVQTGSGAFGNAATRLESWIVKGGPYVYGSYPDLDAMFAEQARENDRAKRTGLLHRMQQILHERSIVAPIWQLAFLNAEGPRIADSALGRIGGHPYAAPYEEVRLKGGA
jgi:peptide/nickel transport system substrate-binding protein